MKKILIVFGFLIFALKGIAQTSLPIEDLKNTLSKYAKVEYSYSEDDFFSVDENNSYFYSLKFHLNSQKEVYEQYKNKLVEMTKQYKKIKIYNSNKTLVEHKSEPYYSWTHFMFYN
jgi:hypothetical protein